MTEKSKIAIIYNQYVDDLFIYAQYLGFEKEGAMDAIHDIFCKISEDAEKLDNIENIKFYLFRSLKNRLIDISKSKRENVEIKTDIEMHPEIPFKFHVSFDDEIISDEDKAQIKQQIEEMLSILTNRQREAIYLRYIQEYDYPQIAEILNISIHSCRKLVSNSILRLREKYGVLVTLLFYL